MLRIERIATMPQEKQLIMLEEFPSRLAEDGQFEHLYTFLTSYDFLQMKMDVIGLEPLIDDYALAKEFEGNAETFTLQRIADALRAGTPILRKAPEELWNQIKGRANFALHVSHPRSIPRLDLRFATLLPASEALKHIFEGHSREVTSCALSADGSLALSAFKDQTLWLWDTASGQLQRTLEEPQSSVRSCMLSADGRLAFAISWNRTLRLWDTTSGQILHTLEGPTGLSTTCGALSANGRKALTGDQGGMLRVWDTTSGKTLCTLKGHRGEVTACALSEDGQLALSASDDRTLRLWDTENGETLHILRGFIGAVDGCALSADGRVALSLSRHPILPLLGHSTLRLWDTAKGRVLRTLKGHRSHILSCAISGDGQLAMSSSPGSFLQGMLGDLDFFGPLLSSLGYFDLESQATLRIWDTATGQVLRALKGYVATSCALSQDGRLALTATTNEYEFGVSSSEARILRLWDTKSKEEGLTQEGHRSPVSACALSANGKLALSASGERTLRLWDTMNGKTLHILKGHRGPVISCALSGDGTLALSLSEDRTIRLWDTAQERTLRTYKIPKNTWGNKRCALSADGRLALLPGDEAAVLWDTVSGQTLHKAIGTTKAFEESFSGPLSKESILRAMEQVEQRKNAPDWEGFWAGIDALSADGRLILSVESGEKGIVRFWDTASGRMLYKLQGHSKKIQDCALSADGEIALAAFEDGILQLWNTTNRQTLGMLEGHSEKVCACTLSGDGQLALAAFEDGVVQLWNTTSRREVARWTHDKDLWCCAFSADGSLVMAGDFDGNVHFLEVIGVTGVGEEVRRRNLNISEKKEEARVPISDKRDENMHIDKQTPQHAVTLQKEPEEMSEERIKERFDKFTERARKVLSLAQEEAQRFQHNYIGTEHLLLGLVREKEGVPAKVLSNLGVEFNKIRDAVEFVIGRGDRVVLSEIGLTPRAKKVIELAVDEARRLNHHYIGTEHLLLGLVREGEGIAAGVLESLGVNLEKVRAQTIQVLNQRKIEEEVRDLAIREQQLGPEHPNVAFSLTRLAELYTDQGKYTEAEPLYQRALRICGQQLEPEHPKVATPLIGLATLYHYQDKYTEAEPLYQQALRILEQQLGPEHPKVTYPLNNLAALYCEQGKYDQAESLYQRALHIREQQWGPEHPNVATLLNNLAELYADQGKYDQADLLYQRTLRIWEQHLGPDHVQVAYPLNGLGDLYKEQGKYAEAEPLYQQALRIWEQQLGPEHPNVAYPLNNLAELYADQGKYDQAEPLYQQALHIRQQQLGPGHPNVAETMHDLARLREAQDRSEEARAWYTGALAIYEQTLGAQRPKTMETRKRLIALLHTLGQHEQAAQLETAQADHATGEQGRKEYLSPTAENGSPIRRMFKTKGKRRMTEYYCVKCKTKREMKDAERVTMKNGKPALKGKCAVCGTTINIILSAALKT